MKCPVCGRGMYLASLCPGVVLFYCSKRAGGCGEEVEVEAKWDGEVSKAGDQWGWDVNSTVKYLENRVKQLKLDLLYARAEVKVIELELDQAKEALAKARKRVRPCS